MFDIQTQLFEGQDIRFGPIDHEKDPELEAKWTHDSEFMRMMDTAPARPISAAMIKKQYEKLEKQIQENKNLYHFMIRAKADDRLIGKAERISDAEVVIRGLVGNQVRGHKCALIYDDEIATGGSIHELSNMLIDEGVEEMLVICTHGVFTRGGLERLAAIPQISQIVTTDTVYIPPEKRHPKLKILSVAPIFADAIRLNLSHESLNDLFVFGE